MPLLANLAAGGDDHERATRTAGAGTGGNETAPRAAADRLRAGGGGLGVNPMRPAITPGKGRPTEAPSTAVAPDIHFERSEPSGQAIFDADGALSRKYLLDRGYCCENDCRNCPYGFRTGRSPTRP